MRAEIGSGMTSIATHHAGRDGSGAGRREGELQGAPEHLRSYYARDARIGGDMVFVRGVYERVRAARRVRA
jgi:hypothetical protein